MTKVYISDTEKLLDGTLFAEYYSRVSHYRKEKVDRLKNDASKRQSLSAGILLQNALSDFGVPSDAEICFEKYGKPYLRDYPDIHFSLSHTKGRAFCVISDSRVGCDVEQIGKARLNVAERFFTEKEKEFLLNISDEEQKNDAFYKLWTLKESYVKLTGEGICLPFDSFGFDISGDEIIMSKHEEKISFQTFSEDGYRYSLAVKDN